MKSYTTFWVVGGVILYITIIIYEVSKLLHVLPRNLNTTFWFGQRNTLNITFKPRFILICLE